ncbi:MAG: exodeoxyribonuclease VII large subunit [Acidobacteria bacterium]|nr:exodeoxyribonuclease VII large subunit [Acidobacteriota bacterium]
MAAPLQAELPLEGERVFSVTEINEQARDLVEEAFRRVRVQGEISGYLHHSSGHRYFTLKDERSSIKCAFFSGRARGLKLKLENGQQVICVGTLSIYTARGEFQLVVESVEMGGLGMLFQKLEALKKKMQAEGLFDEGRKRPLPAFPRKVGVVTSPEGAAIRDILKILRRRAPQIAVLIYPVKVQGEGAAAEIAAGIRWMGANSGCDLIVAGRGGGSIEDLWAFNEEIVARAIADCPLPVISAVGHEKDWLLTDLVADVRAPTPSGAAEILAKSREEIGERIAKLLVQMSSSLSRTVSARRERLFALKDRPGFRRVLSSMSQLIQRVESLRVSSHDAVRRKVEQGRRRLAAERVALERSSPRAILERRVQLVRSFLSRLPLLVSKTLDARRQRAGELRTVLMARAPVTAIAQRRERVGHQGKLLAGAMMAVLEERRTRLLRAQLVLDALGPLKVLERGYSICFREGRRGVVKDASTVATDERLEIQLHVGSIEVVVKPGT